MIKKNIAFCYTIFLVVGLVAFKQLMYKKEFKLKLSSLLRLRSLILTYFILYFWTALKTLINWSCVLVSV